MLAFSRLKISLVLGACLLGILLALPSFLQIKRLDDSFLSNYLRQTVQLGLDLRGGSYLLLDIDIEQYFQEQEQMLEQDVRALLRTNTIGDERITYQLAQLQGKEVMLILRDSAQLDDVLQIIRKSSKDIRASKKNDDTIMIGYRDDFYRTMAENVLSQSIEIVRRRIDETGTKEPVIQRQGDRRILIQVPGVENPDAIKRLLGTTAKLTFHLMDEQPFTTNKREALPPGVQLLEGEEERTKDQQPIYYRVKKRVEINGDTLNMASVDRDQYNRPAVSFRFNAQGTRKFATITRTHVGRPFAVVLDNKVITAPMINEPIVGGSGIISGNFTVQSAGELALLLRAGALPAPINIVEERTVGPSLGADSIHAGKLAATVGMIAVVVFMFLSYGIFGIFSNIALMMNMIFIIAALALFKATLTLPGIAAIVLTIGMAVDANVLIFERIKEEALKGKTPILAVSSGFEHAFKTILDSNITTLIAAILLFLCGAGPIMGFGINLCIGILASFFTAIMLTRLMILTWLRLKRPTHIPL